MTTNLQLNNRNNNKPKQRKQLEEEQNHRNGHHMEGYQQGREGGEWGKGYRELEV